MTTKQPGGRRKCRRRHTLSVTLGAEAIPIVIFTDTDGFVLGHWGPHPKQVQEVMIRFKQQNPDREAADYQDNLKVARQEVGLK